MKVESGSKEQWVTSSLKKDGYKLRGDFLLLVVFIIATASIRTFAPHDGAWDVVKEITGMLMMIFVGIILSHHARIWQKQVK